MENNYQIKWLKKALKNINDEAEYIAKENPKAAQQVVQEIYDAVSLLAGNPALGYSGRIHNTRELVIPDTRYLVPYRVNSKMKTIEILRVFHTSRELPKKW